MYSGHAIRRFLHESIDFSPRSIDFIKYFGIKSCTSKLKIIPILDYEILTKVGERERLWEGSNSAECIIAAFLLGQDKRGGERESVSVCVCVYMVSERERERE